MPPPRSALDQSSGNNLIDRLPAEERGRLLARMEHVDTPVRKVLAEPGMPMPKVYFPTSGILSVVAPLSSGESVEAATVGREGMVGVEVFLGGEGTENTAIISQISGAAWAMDAREFQQAANRPGELRTLMERYSRTLLVQATQSAACNGAHTLERRLAKWFLLIADWLGSNEFRLTHEYVAVLLGAHRPSVTIAAGALQRAGLIEYHRGKVRLLDIEGLRAASCECYEVIRLAYRRLNGPARGDGPGALLRLVAVLRASEETRAAASKESARSSALVEAAAALSAATALLMRRMEATRAGRRAEAVSTP